MNEPGAGQAKRGDARGSALHAGLGVARQCFQLYRGCWRLGKALRGAEMGPRFSEPGGDGEAIFRHACALGWKAFISKRRVHVRMADLSKLLAIEDKTAVRPPATYSLPAYRRLRTGPLCAPEGPQACSARE